MILRPSPEKGRLLDTALLILIAALLPWVVHIAPPRHRFLALVGSIVVLIAYAIFQTSPILRWELWAGLAIGVVSIVVISGGLGRSFAQRPSRSRGFEADPDGSQPTGEIG